MLFLCCSSCSAISLFIQKMKLTTDMQQNYRKRTRVTNVCEPEDEYFKIKVPELFLTFFLPTCTTRMWFLSCKIKDTWLIKRLNNGTYTESKSRTISSCKSKIGKCSTKQKPSCKTECFTVIIVLWIKFQTFLRVTCGTEARLQRYSVLYQCGRNATGVSYYTYIDCHAIMRKEMP